MTNHILCIMFYFADDVTIRKQDDIEKTHNITKSDLNQAVSTLGAFLSVREIFYRIANDLEVMRCPMVLNYQ